MHPRVSPTWGNSDSTPAVKPTASGAGTSSAVATAATTVPTTIASSALRSTARAGVRHGGAEHAGGAPAPLLVGVLLEGGARPCGARRS